MILRSNSDFAKLWHNVFFKRLSSTFPSLWMEKKKKFQKLEISVRIYRVCATFQQTCIKNLCKNHTGFTSSQVLSEIRVKLHRFFKSFCYISFSDWQYWEKGNKEGKTFRSHLHYMEQNAYCFSCGRGWRNLSVQYFFYGRGG